MKKMTTILSIFLFLQLGVSCKKEKVLEPTTPKPPKENSNSNFSQIWNKTSVNGFQCEATIVTSTNVIYWIDMEGGSFRDDMIAFDKNTGDTLWYKQGTGVTGKHKLIGNYVYYDLNERLICMDPSTGNEVWRLSPAYLSDYIYANGSIYAFFYTRDSAMLYKINPITGSNNKIYTIYSADRDGYSQSPNGMVYWKHPNGNDIIFVQSSGLKVSVGRGEYYAIDITGDSIYWDLGEYFSGSGGIGFSPLLAGSNININNGTLGVASLNLVTKTTNWKVTEPLTTQTGGKYAILKNNKIFKEAGNIGHFNIIDINNGSQLKTYTNIGTSFRGSPLRIYNNKIYFTTTEILGIIDANTANMVQKLDYKQKVGETLGGFHSGMDIDPMNGYIYTVRYKSFVCIKEK